MAKKKPKRCDCFSQADRTLRERTGARFESGFEVDFYTNEITINGPYLAVEWVKVTRGNRKLPTVLCTFCPFCGKAL